MKITNIESNGTIQLPPDWIAELGLDSIAALEKSDGGILVRPCPSTTWDEIFADKLPAGTQPAALDLSEMSGDDYLF